MSDTRLSVAGDVETVNGAASCGRGVEAGGEVSTVNGEIALENAAVARDVWTCTGDILLRDQSRVGGNLVVERVVYITDDSSLKGEVIGGRIAEESGRSPRHRAVVRVAVARRGIGRLVVRRRRHILDPEGEGIVTGQ